MSGNHAILLTSDHYFLYRFCLCRNYIYCVSWAKVFFLFLTLPVSSNHICLVPDIELHTFISFIRPHESVVFYYLPSIYRKLASIITL